MKTQIFRIGLIALMLAVAGIIFWQQRGLSAAQRDAAQKAIQALNKVNAATEVGVSYLNYGPLLIEAKAAVNAASVMLPESTLRNSLERTMAHYQMALAIWQICNDNYGSLTSVPQIRETLKAVYNLTNSQGYQLEYVDKAQVLPVIWSKAKSELDNAQKLVR